MKFHAIKNDPEAREPKDLLDIIQLVQRNGMDLSGPGFRKMCDTYGTPDLFKKIKMLTNGAS